jgi:hypothetical protein
LPGGLTITATNGGNLPALLPRATQAPSFDAYFVYMDGVLNAGPGVCLEDDGDCAGISDNNHMPGEYIHMDFGKVVNVLSVDITGMLIGGTDDLMAGWLTQISDYTVFRNFADNSQMYLSSITVSAVPVPAAVWLFGSAISGLNGFSKRRKIAPV